MLKSLTNRLFLKKQLYEFKMIDGTDVRDHINKFNKCITQLLSVESSKLMKKSDNFVGLPTKIMSDIGDYTVGWKKVC